nr:hypothetical protein [Tanacetum cinerariifolium]
MHNQQKVARDFPFNIECRGNHHKSHMKKRFCLPEQMVLKEYELLSCVGLDFHAQQDDSRMWSEHLDAKR